MEIEHYRRLVEEAFPDIVIRTCEAILEGWDFYVLEVNGDLIFRFPRRQDVLARQEREIRFLPSVAQALPVSVPEFKMISRDGSREPSLYVGYPKIHGHPLSREKLGEDGVRRSIARGLARVLTALHGMPVGDRSTDGLMPGNMIEWRREQTSLLQYATEHIFPLLSSAVRRRESIWWTNFVADDSKFAFEPALVHADLGPLHILCDYEHGHVVGIIDWGDAAIGDPAIDFAGFLHYPGEGFALEVLSFYRRQTDAEFMSRVRYYHRLGPYHEVRFGQEHGFPRYVRSGIAAIEASQPTA